MTDDDKQQALAMRHHEPGATKGPPIGTLAPDFNAYLLDGRHTQLSAYLSSLTVLEMGSITCPIYQSRLKGMNHLAHQFPNTQFLVLYVREAHPGNHIGQHRSLAEKQACAAELEQEFGETRTLLVDDLSDHAHALYGAMPNSIFIINGDGIIVFSSDWNDVNATATALCRLQEGKSASNVRSYFKPATPWVAREVFRHAGKGAATDFLRSFPARLGYNFIAHNLKQLIRD